MLLHAYHRKLAALQKNDTEEQQRLASHSTLCIQTLEQELFPTVGCVRYLRREEASCSARC